MNEIFNFKRFLRYASMQYRVNRKGYQTDLWVLLALNILLVSVVRYGFNSTYVGYYVSLARYAMIVCSALFVFQQMRHLRGRHSAAISCMVPASQFEKYLFVWFNSAVVFTALYMLTVLVVKLLCVGILGFHASGYYPMLNDNPWVITALSLFLGAAALFAGTTQIRSHFQAFLLVMICAAALFLLPALLPAAIDSIFTNDTVSMTAFFNVFDVTLQGDTMAVEYHTPRLLPPLITLNGRIWSLCYMYGWALLLSVAGWFNFRERSVK